MRPLIEIRCGCSQIMMASAEGAPVGANIDICYELRRA
jgi:hypothetical protein